MGAWQAVAASVVKVVNVLTLVRPQELMVRAPAVQQVQSLRLRCSFRYTL